MFNWWLSKYDFRKDTRLLSKLFCSYWSSLFLLIPFLFLVFLNNKSTNKINALKNSQSQSDIQVWPKRFLQGALWNRQCSISHTHSKYYICFCMSLLSWPNHDIPCKTYTVYECSYPMSIKSIHTKRSFILLLVIYQNCCYPSPGLTIFW